MLSKATTFLPGTLDLLVLRTLLVSPKHVHGVTMANQGSSDDMAKVEQGSLYPALLDCGVRLGTSFV